MSDCHPSISVPIIGYHRSPLKEKFGIPRQPNLVSLISYIDLLSPYGTIEAFEGLDNFSHLWISWYAHHNHLKAKEKDRPFKPKVRPPRLGGNAKLGVFATRSTYRPSQLGMSVVKYLGVKSIDSGVRVYILGSDMVDGTPIVDIKPYVAYSDAVVEANSGYAAKKPVSKKVVFSEQAIQQFKSLLSDDDRFEDDMFLSNRLLNDRFVDDSAKNSHTENYVNSNVTASKIFENFNKSAQFNNLFTDQLNTVDFDIIRQLVSQDPRPAYQNNTYQYSAQQHSTHQRIYYMRYKKYDVGFKIVESTQCNVISKDSSFENTIYKNQTDEEKIPNQLPSESLSFLEESTESYKAKVNEYMFLIVSIHLVEENSR